MRIEDRIQRKLAKAQSGKMKLYRVPKYKKVVGWGLIVLTSVALALTAKGLLHKNSTKVVSNDQPAPTLAPTDEMSEAEQFRHESLANIYNFVDGINSTNAVSIDGETLMFTMQEGEAFYLYNNDFTKSDIYNYFGSHEVNFDDIKKNYEQSLLKLRIYYANSKKESGITSLILDEDSKKFLSEYEKAHIAYNNLKPAARTDEAKDIIEMFKSDYIDGSNLPYEDVNAGVARTVLTTFGTLDQIGWRNSTVKFPSDIRSILNDIETGLCGRTNLTMKDLLDNLSTLQTVEEYMKSKETFTNDENSYDNMLKYYNDKLQGYNLTGDRNLDVNNPDVFSNYNGTNKAISKVTTSSNGKSSNGKGKKTSKTKTTKKKVLEEGYDWTPKDIHSVVDELPEEARKSGEEQIDKIENSYEEKNKAEESKGKGMEAGYNAIYDTARLQAEQGGSKLPYMTYNGTDPYQIGYAEGYNKGVDYGYQNGLDNRSKMVTPTPTPVPSSSNSSQPTPTPVPQYGDGVQIDDEYKGEFDGPLYDKDGNIIGKANSINDALNVLYAKRNELINYANIQALKDNGYSKSMC